SARTARIRETICPPLFLLPPGRCINRRARFAQTDGAESVDDSIRLAPSASIRCVKPARNGYEPREGAPCCAAADCYACPGGLLYFTTTLVTAGAGPDGAGSGAV